MKSARRQKNKIWIFVLLFSLIFTLTATASGPGVVIANDVNMRSGPSTNSEVLIVLYNGAIVNVHGSYGNWYEIDYNGLNGYVYRDYISLTGETVVYNLEVNTFATHEISTSIPTPTIAPILVPINTPTPISTNITGQDIINTATQYLGTPYVWGGESLEEGGFDCSGFIYRTFLENGIEINRVAQQMIRNGIEVDLNNLKLGDILLFGDSIYNIWHAGIYIGDDNIIHASYGEVVKIQNINELRGMHLVAARRVIE